MLNLSFPKLKQKIKGPTTTSQYIPRFSTLRKDETNTMLSIKEDNVDYFKKEQPLFKKDYIELMLRENAFKCLNYMHEKYPTKKFKIKSFSGISKKSMRIYNNFFAPNSMDILPDYGDAFSGKTPREFAAIPENDFEFYLANFPGNVFNDQTDIQFLSDNKIIMMLENGFNIFGSSVPIKLIKDGRFLLVKKMVEDFHFSLPMLQRTDPIFESLLLNNYDDLFKRLFIISGNIKDLYLNRILLNIAARQNKLEIIRLIIGDTDYTYNEILYIALKNGYKEIAEFGLNHANNNIREFTKTAIDYGNTDMWLSVLSQNEKFRGELEHENRYIKSFA